MTSAVAEMKDAAAAARRPRVLLAGLDPGTRAVARVALGDRVDVIEADGDDVLERAREERPDIVLVPWRGNARTLVSGLGDDAMTRDAKVLLLVDDASARSREVAAVGADERLSSPFSPLQLQVKLRKLLGGDVIGV
jgi:serine/threonine-protein kinase